MYKDVLNLSYSQCREVYPQFVSIDKANKVIAMKNGNDIDSISNESDILVYYDIIVDSKPLMLVERISCKDKSVGEVEQIVEKERVFIPNYHFNITVSEDKCFVDVVLMDRNVYERLSDA